MSLTSNSSLSLYRLFTSFHGLRGFPLHLIASAKMMQRSDSIGMFTVIIGPRTLVTVGDLNKQLYRLRNPLLSE